MPSADMTHIRRQSAGSPAGTPSNCSLFFHALLCNRFSDYKNNDFFSDCQFPIQHFSDERHFHKTLHFLYRIVLSEETSAFVMAASEVRSCPEITPRLIKRAPVSYRWGSTLPLPHWVTLTMTRPRSQASLMASINHPSVGALPAP